MLLMPLLLLGSQQQVLLLLLLPHCGVYGETQGLCQPHSREVPLTSIAAMNLSDASATPTNRYSRISR
mgnify:FL=1